MSAGFGFSVGDFIAALGLVRDVIDALQDSGTVRRRFRGLLQQLYSLESALQHVHRLDVDDVADCEGVDRASEVLALRESAARCQRSIDDFYTRVRKYLPGLQDDSVTAPATATATGRTERKWTRAWRRVHWSLCHKDDITRLQSDLMAHTESINLLLATIQLNRTQLESRVQTVRHQTLTRRIQGSYFICMNKLSVISDAIVGGVHQGKQLVQLTTNIIETNIRIFQTVLSIHHHLLSIPGQIERQQPVLLVDALGRHCPFHLEFIRSSKALLGVLEANFEKFGDGADKVRRKEFAIEDVASKEDIDLDMDWETCFRPGQRVEMSMVFERPLAEAVICPRCTHKCREDSIAAVTCSDCGLMFERIAELEDLADIVEVPRPQPWIQGPCPTSVNDRSLKRRRTSDDEELRPFRKVRIRSMVPLSFSQTDSIRVDGTRSPVRGWDAGFLESLSSPMSDDESMPSTSRRSSVSSFGSPPITPPPSYEKSLDEMQRSAVGRESPDPQSRVPQVDSSSDTLKQGHGAASAVQT